MNDDYWQMRAHWDETDAHNKRAEQENARPPKSLWRPIDTAPRDREVILWNANTTSPFQGRWIKPNDMWLASTKRYADEGWYWAGYSGAVGPVQPSHWRPLPEPPDV